MIIRNDKISWSLDPVRGGELKFSFEVFNGSIFPYVKVGHAIEGELIEQSGEFHDRFRMELPKRIMHGCWDTIVIIQHLTFGV